MSYHIELRPERAVILETWGADYDPGTETKPAVRDEVRLLNQAGRPVVLVVDIRAVVLTFDDILYLASAGFPQEVIYHPNFQGEIIVTTDDVVIASAAASAEGLDNDVFGRVRLHIVSSLGEAFALACQMAV